MKEMKIKEQKIEFCYIVKVYLKKRLFRSYKLPKELMLTQDELEAFCEELNQLDKTYVNFGGFIFKREDFKYAKPRLVKIKVK